jgi:hypothetical protein
MFVRAGCDEDLAAVVRLERAMAEAPHWPEGEYRAALAGGGGGGTIGGRWRTRC